jgi:hypothetical protein
MGKTLKEISTRSASAETKPVGAAMSLEDLDIDVRAQTVAESLGRVLPASPPSPMQSVSPRSIEPSPAQVEAPAPIEKKKATTQMLSTPIPAATKKRLNRLRLEHSISTAFVLQVALDQFFGDRTDETIAAELQARGGRLRRSNG